MLGSHSRHATPPLSPFISLPNEILEQVFLALPLTDRFALLQTCSTLRDIYHSSSQLEYDLTLITSSYLDIPNSALLPRRIQKSPDRPGIVTSEATVQSSSAIVSNSTLPKVSLPSSLPPVRKSGDPLSAAEKNKLLKDREKRWETLDAAHKKVVSVRGPAGIYELQEGIFLMCENPSDEDGGKPKAIRLVPLPSAEDPNVEDPDVDTKLHQLPFPIADLTMDPTQDLIVVSEHGPAAASITAQTPTHRFHLLTLSTFKPHPLASMPTLDFPPFAQAAVQTRQLLQIMGDTLVVLVSGCEAHWLVAGLNVIAAGMAGMGPPLGMGNEEEIVAWNWKTGRVLSRITLPETLWFASFALLTPTSFMITTTSSVSRALSAEPQFPLNTFPPVIQIYSFLPDPDNTIIPVQPLEADYMDDTTARPVLLAQLDMPPLVTGTVIGSFDVRPDPAFPPVTTKSNSRIGPGKAFTQDPEKGVLVFELQIMEPVDRDGGQVVGQFQTYELFVLRETLINLAKDGEERLKRARTAEGKESGFANRRIETTLPWQQWGETQARLMEVSMTRRNWVCSCSGYRFVALVPSFASGLARLRDEAAENPAVICDLRVLDFSPYSVAREISKRRNKLDDSTTYSANGINGDGYEEDDSVCVDVFTEPTVITKSEIFVDPVQSGLPFREVIRDIGIRANGVMIDDQRVLIVCTNGRRRDWRSMRQDMTILCM